MLGWAMEECRRRGCSDLQLTSDLSRTDTRRFYERLGFTAVSSGCIRLLNHDVIHLHERVRDGSTIIILHEGSERVLEA